MQQSSLPFFPVSDIPEITKPKYRIPVYSVKLVKDSSLKLGDKIQEPTDAGRIALEYLRDVDREHFIVLLLDTKHRVIGINTAHIGTLNQATICAREVFKPAILANSCAIIVAHNHPSSDLTPSPEDLRVTKDLVRAGELLDISVLDHLIIGFERYKSLRDFQAELFLRSS
jgi:DNA repair protein RadC